MKRFRIVKKPYIGMLCERYYYRYVVQREVSLLDLHLFWESIDWHFNEDRAKEILESIVGRIEHKKVAGKEGDEVVLVREVE